MNANDPVILTIAIVLVLWRAARVLRWLALH